MEHIFEEIAKEQNTTYTPQRSVYYAGSEGNDFQNHYRLDIKHKGETIIVTNMLGAQSYGRINLEINNSTFQYPFKITTIDHLEALIFFKKDRMKIKCKDISLKVFLDRSQDLDDMKYFLKATTFSPTIEGKFKDGTYTILTEYHINFPERGEVIRPLIDLYKSLIDYIKG